MVDTNILVAASLALLFAFFVAKVVIEAVLRRRLDGLARQVSSFRFWRIETVPLRMGPLRNMRFGWRTLALLVDEGHQIRLKKAHVLGGQPDDWVLDKRAVRARLCDEDGWRSTAPMWALLEAAGVSGQATEPILYWTLISPAGTLAYPTRDDLLDCLRQMFPDSVPQHYTAVRPVWQSFKGAIWLCALVLGVCGWAALDTFWLNTWNVVPSSLGGLINSPLTWWSAGIIAALIALGAFLLLRPTRFALRDKVGVALAVMLLLPFLAGPVVKRLDQGLASTPVVSAAYVRQADGNWHPLDKDADLPLVGDVTIGLAEGNAPEVGEQRELRLLHGALGLWQIDTGFALDWEGSLADKLAVLWPLLFALFAVLTRLWLNHRAFRGLAAKQQRWVDASQGKRFWRVALARPAYRQRWFNLLPQESLGVLTDEGEQIRFRGQWPDEDTAFELLVDKASAQLRGQTDTGGNWRRQGWVEIQTSAGPIMFTPQPSARSVLNSYEGRPTSSQDLLHTLFPEHLAAVRRGWPFALESSAAALVVILVSLAGLAWASIDTYAVNPFKLADGWLAIAKTAPWFVLGALMLAAGAAWGTTAILASRAVPKLESRVVAGLLAVACASVFTTLFKRVDLWVAPQASDKFRYAVDVGGIARRLPADVGGDASEHAFKPPGAVDLRLPGSFNWPAGSTVEVEWVRGASGLWQFNRHSAYLALIQLKAKASSAPSDQ
jgi:hypothetical protein